VFFSLDGFGVLVIMSMYQAYEPMIPLFVRYHRMHDSDWKHGIEWGIRLTFA